MAIYNNWIGKTEGKDGNRIENAILWVENKFSFHEILGKIYKYWTQFETIKIDCVFIIWRSSFVWKTVFFKEYVLKNANNSITLKLYSSFQNSINKYIYT